MANETGPSDLGQGLVRENWGGRYVKALYAPNNVLPLAANITGDYNRGDIANVPVAPTLTVGTIGATGALNPQTATHTNVQVSIATAEDVTVELTGVARMQAEKIFEEDFPTQAGDAARAAMTGAFLAQYSSLTTTAIGDGAGNLGEDELLAAIQAAKTANMPVEDSPNEFYFALADNQLAPLRKLKCFDWTVTGVAGESASKQIKLPDYGGIPVRFSTKVATSGGIRKGVFAHRDTMVWAAQQMPEAKFADRLAAAKWSYLMACISLYGVGITAAGRGWVINSKA